MSLYRNTALLFAAIGLLGQAHAQEVDFSGQVIEFVVPFGPGGGSSTYARILAPLLEQELPGNPTIVIRNIEGGASVRGINQFAQRARPDGLTIATLGNGTYHAYLLNMPTVEYPLSDFIPVLASPYGLLGYVRTDHGLTGDPLEDIRFLQENPPIYAGDSPTGSDMPVLYCFNLLGIDVAGVFGVSRGEARQAFMRGEAQANFDNLASWNTELQPMIEDGTMVPLFTMGFIDENGEIGRDPTQPDTPTCSELYELVNGEPIGGVERAVYEAMYAVRMSIAKSIVLPPDTPEHIVRTYQDAIERVVERPELQEPNVQIELGGYPQLTGDAAIQGHRQASVMTPEANDALLGWLRDRWDMDL